MPSMLNPGGGRARFLELTSEEWFVLFAGALVFVAVLAAIRTDVTLWPAIGLGFTALVGGHLCMTARRYVAFPDLVAAACCLQWIVAPWLADAYPSKMVVYHMVLTPSEYLQYSVPATIALWIGLHLPASRRLSKTWVMPELEPLSKPMRRTLDAAIVIGLIFDVYSEYVPSELAFLAYLIASFRFVGALGWMITQTPGWGIRAFGVMLYFVATQSAGGGMFYLVVHWGGYFLLVYGFMKRWRTAMAFALIVGIMGLALLQSVKPTFRASLIEERPSGPVEALTRLTSMLWEHVSQGYIVDPNTDTGDTLVRFNQGWIIARIMKRVPAEVPYARGQTLADAALFTVVPRFLVPSKREGASTQLFTRFTGITLPPNTRMGLGVIGELYANFGILGGVVSTFIYGTVMGFLFLFFADRAQRNPLWWAVAPSVLLPCVEPGFNIEDVSNHVVKGAVVFLLVWKFYPPVQRLLAMPSYETVDEGEGEEVASSFDHVVTDH